LNEQRLEKLQLDLGIKLQNPQWLAQALHIGALVVPEPGLASHDVLEFMGDTVLGTVLKTLLLEQRGGHEGVLTQMYELAGSNRFLAQVSEDLGLPDYATMPPGWQAVYRTSDPEHRWKKSADLLEAVVGAIFLDGGHDYDAAASFIRRLVWPRLQALMPEHIPLNPRALLFDCCREQFGSLPYYYVDKRESPQAGKRPHYVARAYVDGRQIGYGKGRGTWQAETDAARAALAQEFGLTQRQIREGRRQ
jgi:dsRNA-specific ribonuclease